MQNTDQKNYPCDDLLFSAEDSDAFLVSRESLHSKISYLFLSVIYGNFAVDEKRKDKQGNYFAPYIYPHNRDGI